jgi:hypothetical protein
MLAECPETLAQFEHVAKLVEGFESPFGLEFLATVHWIMMHEGAAPEEDVLARTYDRGERKRSFLGNRFLLARRRVTERGWRKNGRK